MIACLTHDIGYVRGILAGDADDGFVVDSSGRKVKLPRGASDAALLPHHVDRSKLFIMDRFKGFEFLDPARIARAVEGTRFPSTMPAELEDDRRGGEHSPRRRPDRAARRPALHPQGQCPLPRVRGGRASIAQLGYDNPADLVNRYPQFYWNSVAPHVQIAIRYLNVTASGRQWIANLYSNVFRAERDIALSGPQK